ncbi:MAG: aminotransferase-like domain-containing protein [Actinomycetes bacterium]
MSNDSSVDRIADRLRVLAAAAPPGSRLPSTRALVQDFAASPVTVQMALARLVAENLVETRPGAGSFVAHGWSGEPPDLSWQTRALGPLRTRANPVGTSLATVSPDAIALHSGYPAESLLPGRLVRASLARAARGPTALGRPPAGGLPELRAWFAGELAHATPRGTLPPTAADVVVTPGGQSALCSVFRALAAPGEPIVMESPTYWGAIAAAEQAGLMIVPVPRGTTAPSPDDVARALASSGARLFYAQPHFANPTGTTWTLDEGSALLKVVTAHDAFLVEDDWGHDFAFAHPVSPLAARDTDGHVVYIRSLTKSLAPALRVAAVVARGPARTRIHTDRTIDDLYVSGLLQTAALDVLTQPAWRTHVRSTARRLAERRDALATLLRRHAPGVDITLLPAGGLHLWVRLPDGTDPVSLTARCAARGLHIAPGHEWFPTEPPAPHLRLSYAVADPARFRDAVDILARELAREGG